MTEPIKDTETGRFVAGGSSRGRKKGSRNRLHADFVAALQEHFEEEGHKAIEIAYRENPIDYLKVIVSVLPKAFQAEIDVDVEHMVTVVELVDGMPTADLELVPERLEDEPLAELPAPASEAEPRAIERQTVAHRIEEPVSKPATDHQSQSRLERKLDRAGLPKEARNWGRFFGAGHRNEGGEWG
jgi:hypothetical protein